MTASYPLFYLHFTFLSSFPSVAFFHYFEWSTKVFRVLKERIAFLEEIIGSIFYCGISSTHLVQVISSLDNENSTKYLLSYWLGRLDSAQMSSYLNFSRVKICRSPHF